jgi:DNA-binding MarR family transcriptional regulator
MDLTEMEIVREALRHINRRAGVLKADPYGIGLSLSQGSALVDIERFGSLRPNDLVRLLHLEKSSVSRLLTTLVERDLIAVGDDQKDGRSKIVTLTRSGRKAVQVINNQSNGLVREVLDALSLPERKKIVTALGKLVHAFDKNIPKAGDTSRMASI